MSLFASPAEHAANPPATWEVHRAGPKLWRLTTASGTVLDVFTTRRGAEGEREDGHLVSQYNAEGRWYAGEPVRGWRSWADVSAEHDRIAARQAARAAQRAASTPPASAQPAEAPEEPAAAPAPAQARPALTVTRHRDGQVLHTGTSLPAALAVLDAAGHASAVLRSEPLPEPVAPPTRLSGAVEPLLPLEDWPTPAAEHRAGHDVLALF